MISITLPTLNPSSCTRTLKNIRAATRDKYQVIVVSPFQPLSIVAKGSELIWIKDEKKLGCNWAHCEAAKKATGDYITAWVDDHLYADGWDQEVLEQYEASDIALLGLRQVYPSLLGSVFGYYYPYFPFTLGDYAVEGLWFDSDYKADFADVDLAFNFYDNNLRSEWMRVPVISTLGEDGAAEWKTKAKAEHTIVGDDVLRFLQRWHKTMGSGWATQDLREYNIDHYINQLPAEGLKCAAS